MEAAHRDHPRSIGRSIGAVLAGIVVAIVLTLAADVLMHAIGVYPALGQPIGSKPLLLATAYRIVFGVVGGSVTARLAPYDPMKHSLAGGVFGTIAGIAGALATWNKGLGPHWYAVAVIVIALPSAWLGAKLRLRQISPS